jgi:hypothetical protein
VIHRGLRRFIERDDASGVPAALVPKVRNIVSFLQDMGHESELRTVPSWKAHLLDCRCARRRRERRSGRRDGRLDRTTG